MSCLFRCFRARAERSTIDDSVSQPPGLNSNRSGHDSTNRLSALFLSQDSSPCHHHSQGSGLHIHKDLQYEAQLLKTCSAATATPIEIRKTSEELETPQRGKQFTSSQFHSWISDAVFHLDEAKTDEPCGEFSEQTPSSCMTDARNSARISTGYSDAGEESIGTEFRDGLVDRSSKAPVTDGNITGKKEPVRFECDFDRSYSFSSSKNSISKIPEKAGKTSLKLSDEIQTPGTMIPANMESAARGRARTRSQRVHSPSNLIANASICNLPEDSDEIQEHTKVQACKEKKETESLLSVTCEGKLEESSEKSEQNMTDVSTITYGDRPIIGTAAAHWNEKEQSQISPKWWDGNGIPNSTNKYKEDQKVRWHATSFEERLEKALSEEGGHCFIPSRKLEVMEDAERDTAMSQLHHPAQSTSIVSF
ncbi:protein JASON isoform X2 [Raphanus sativus]|uniref:Protein JASON isoform X2 n=1 Tax=Raphanus sativus TaxID=3726 RepID=A0A6J0N7I2_RAPSA|nr:protein JASON isoform X2 [Raphanus sativus]